MSPGPRTRRCRQSIRSARFTRSGSTANGFGILSRLKGGGFQLRRLERKLRFAVHGPPGGVASPRFHGVPRRDVACRVHVGVAGELAGRAAEEGLALAVLRCDVPARRAALARERGWYLLDSSGCLVVKALD